MNLKGIMNTLGAKPGQVMSDPYARAFAPQPTVEVVKEEEDHEVSMANNSLDTIIKMATELKAKMGENEKDIPAWIQDHISKAENYISQASSNYHEYGNSNESVNEAVSYKDGKYHFYSKDGVGYLTYDGKEISSGDFDYEDGSNSYWMSHSTFKGQKAFDTGKDVIKYFKSKNITTESINEARLTDIVRSIVETPVIGKIVSKHRVEEAKKYDIGSGYMGNGLTIWNRAEEEHGDYKIIAHISPQGKLSVRDKQLPADLKKMFQIWADSMAKGKMGPKY